MLDHYEILGVNPTASHEEIRAAYRRLAQRYHPDRAQGNESRFRRLQQSYEVLSHPILRRQYDAERRNQSISPDEVPAYLDTLFRHFFEGI